MTGLDGRRVYLDWNATAPLRPEARAAMLAAMDAPGNPSSVHAEGRAARGLVERARGQVAALVGCDPAEVVFTSGATEAAALALAGRPRAIGLAVEHDAIDAWLTERIGVSRAGLAEPGGIGQDSGDAPVCVQAANGETGVLQAGAGAIAPGATLVRDLAQSAGKIEDGFDGAFGLVAAHKLGGPKGVGALIARRPVEPALRGGGQERGRRSGTENVVGIAGFGAAAEAARRDLEAGVWDGVAALRDALEARLIEAAPELVIFGREAARLPNTSCFAVPGWAGETQVMQMDLAGFAVSAGSACSSGKVRRASRVLLAMGFDEATASSAIRVSIGPATTEAELAAFAEAWTGFRRRNSKAA
jgi:cysteine desulfurase